MPRPSLTDADREQLSAAHAAAVVARRALSKAAEHLEQIEHLGEDMATAMRLEESVSQFSKLLVERGSKRLPKRSK